MGAAAFSAAAALPTAAILFTRSWSPLRIVLVTVTAAYLPFYLEPRHLRGDDYRRSAAFWGGWRLIWTKLLCMPRADVRLHNPKEFGDPKAQRIFGSHPHGVASMHHMGVMMCPPVCEPGKSFEEVCPGSRRCELAATVLFRLPLVRELALALGCCDASRAVVDSVLSKGMSIGVMVGGEQEQLLSRRGEHTVYLQKRKGLMKLALRHGIPIVPCYCFGETDLYHNSAFMLRLRQWLAKTFGIAITFAYGRSLLVPFLPIPTQLVQVVGTPISVEKVDAPTEVDIDRVHALYVKGLREVFEQHKASLGYADATLKMV